MPFGHPTTLAMDTSMKAKFRTSLALRAAMFCVATMIVSCAWAVAMIAIGSAVMKSGTAKGYDVPTAAQNGIIGGAILLVPLSAITSTIVVWSDWYKDEYLLASLPLSYLAGIILAAPYGTLGSVVLSAAGHGAQGLKETAISAGVGAAILLSPIVALCCCGGGGGGFVL